MHEDLSTRLDIGRQRLDALQQLRPQLPAAEEALAQTRYELLTIEDCLTEAGEDVRMLESLTVGSVMAAIMGQRDGKLMEKREEADALHQQYDACVESIAAADEMVHAVEQQLADLTGVEEDYDVLCEEKVQLILQAGGENAQELEDVSTQLDLVKQERHKLQTIIQIGKQLQERLHSMTRSAGRARGKTPSMYVVGVIPALATGAVTSQAARGSVDRARDGFEKFHRALSDLDLSGGTHNDVELMRMIAVVAECSVSLSLSSAVSDVGSAWPMVDAVQEALGHLKEKSKEVDLDVAALDDQRRILIESL